MTEINRAEIDKVHAVIAPHVRETPVMTVAAEDFGLTGAPIAFKLELLQHAGVFKPRGAFANLLLRDVPKAGVVAASGGNHGAAVAFAAKRLGIPAKIFIPTVASPAKIAQIRSYGAELVVEGARYADALALSQDWAAKTGALQIHAFDQPETLLGQGTVAREFAAQAPRGDHLAGGGRRRRPDRRHGGVERGPAQDRGGRAGGRADAAHGARGGQAGRCAGRRHRRGFAGAASRSAA